MKNIYTLTLFMLLFSFSGVVQAQNCPELFIDPGTYKLATCNLSGGDLYMTINGSTGQLEWAAELTGAAEVTQLWTIQDHREPSGSGYVEITADLSSIGAGSWTMIVDQSTYDNPGSDPEITINARPGDPIADTADPNYGYDQFQRRKATGWSGSGNNALFAKPPGQGNFRYTTTPVPVAGDPVVFKSGGTINDLRFIFVSALPTEELDFYNTQWLSDGTNGSNTSLSVNEGTTITVYSKAYEAGVTDAVGQGAGIECWIGFNSADTDPSTWDESAWQVASFGQDNGNDDEYNYSTSSTAVGTHYIATRWRLNSGSYTYGGASASNGGAWDGVNNNNIGLTVNAVAQPLVITTSTCASASEVRLTGPWWGWDPAGGPVAADNGDGTWTFTFDPAPTDNMEYLLVVDGVQENLISIMANGGDCAPVTDYANYANRRWDLGSGNVTNTYGQCGSTCVAPVITLTGSDVTLNVGDTYTDAGATASDDEEGDISANIVVGGDTVDTATAGTYTITYDVSDGAGNAATQVSRTVTVTQPSYCDSVPTSNDASGISSVAFNGTDFTSGGDITYEDFTATAVEAGQSTTASLSITFATGYTYDTHVWVDLNDDYNFDSSELLFTGESLSTNPTTLDASFLVPSDAPLGDHRVRIGTADSGQSTPDPCYSGSYGVTIDMTITVVEPPSCLAPSALTAANITASSADITWTAGGTETDYEYVIQVAGTGEPTAAGTAVAGATSVSLSALTDNTDYEVYVRSACAGGEFSTWAGPVTITTLCDAYSTFPFTETFNSDSSSASCWTVDNANGDMDSWTTSYGSNTNEGDGVAAMYTDYNSGSNDDWLISPGFQLTGNERLKFQQRVQSSNEPNDFEVLLSSTTTETASFTTVLLANAEYSNTEYQEIIIDLSSYTGVNYIAFHVANGGLDGWRLYIDDVVVEEIPACLVPSDLTASNLTTTSADITWVSDSASFNIEYGVNGFTQGEGTSDTASSNTYSLSGLSANTSYDVYVQSDCGSSGVSEWAGPVTFTTLCDAYSTFPFTETFNSDSSSASCWTVDNANGDMDSWTTSYGSNTNEGDGVAAMYTDYNSGANDDWLISPGFQLTGNERLKFQQRVQSSGEPNDFEVLLSSTTAETASFTTVLLANAEYSNTAYQEIIIDLSSYTGVNYIAFHVANGGLDGWRLYIDDVVVEEIPSTPPGCAANFSNTLDASCGNFDFDISWDATDGADGYYITVGTTSGGSDIEASTDLGSATSYSFTNVQVATTYYYTVVPYNANGSATGCLEKSITTATTGCYCDSVPTSNDASGISSVAFNGTDFTSGGDITYEDFTATAVEAGQSTTASLSITFATGYTYDTHVWVDLNDDYNFDSSELLFTGESLSTNPTTLDASFLVPSDAPLGDHRVRIGTADSGQSTPDPCYSGSYGVTIDMTITVVAPPSCIGPSALTVSNLSYSSADISWTAGGSESDYEYVVQAAGTGEPTAAGTAVAGATSVSLSALTDNTDYEVYVRSACAGGEFSSWTGPLSFTTEPAPIVPAYTNDFSTYPGEFWTEGTGALADGPSGTTSAWSADGFGNNGTTGAAKVNVYYSSFSGSGNDDWLISPMFDLSGGTYYLNLNVALTTWNSTSSTTFGAGDFVALMVTEDDGSTWSELYRWDANNTPSATGDAMPEIDLSSYTSMTKFAFYAESTTGNVDNDFFIDDFQITTTSLGVDDNSISLFNYFPNPVNDVLTIKAQNSVEDVKVFNMLGQMVLRQNPNTRDCTVDLSAMQTGAYFVQVSIGNTVETVRVLKK